MRHLHFSAASRVRPSRALAVVAAAALVMVAAPSAQAAGRAPLGFVDRVTTGTGSVTVSGWATDLDSSAPIQVHVYAGRTFIGALRADSPRPDVAAAVGGSGAAGFSGTLPVGEGTHDICVYAIDDSNQVPNPTIGCARVSVSNALPRGFMDAAAVSGGTGTVSGWVLDPDTSASIDMHAYLDDAFVGAVTANGSRPDVANAFGLGAAHGFSLSFPIPSGSHRLCLYGINTPAGVNPQFLCTIVAGAGNTMPLGSVDAVSAVQGSLSVAGWALDPDVDAPIAVHVYVDDAFATAGSAALDRPDVAAALGRGAQHGFSLSVPAAAGPHRVCVFAINTPTGINPTLGCTSVVVPGQAPAPAPAPQTPTPAGRTVIDGDLTVTTPGTVVANVDIRGYLRIKAPDVTVQNTIVRGRPGLTGSMALVQASSTGTRIIDSELVAADPTYYIDGIVGSGFTLTRVNIHGVVDSVKITGDNVLVEDSWLHDNLYYASVPSGGDTHNDNVQIQRGNNITIRSSVLSGTRNAALMVTQDSGPVTNLTFTANQADNGGCTINLAEKSYGPVAATITNNRFGTAQRVAYCAVIGKATTYAASTISGNTFTDGTAFAVSLG